MAGESAQVKAEQLSASASSFEEKAKAAKKAAKAYELGAAGEDEVALLLAPLSSRGYFLLHDRKLDGLGGNVDHIVLGPAGVFVINAKNWQTAHFRNGVLHSGPYKANKTLERQAAETSALEKLLANAGIQTSVSSVMIFVKGFKGEPSGEFVALTSADALTFFEGAEKLLSAFEVENILGAILKVTHSASEKISPVTKEAFALEAATSGRKNIDELEKYYSRIYVKEWAKVGQRRLYFFTAGGREAGVHDLITHQATVKSDCPEMRMMRSLVNVATVKDLETLKIPLVIPDDGAGASVMNLLAKINIQLLVGWYWFSRGQHLLFVHLLQRGKATLELGSINLDTGEIRVKHELKDRASSSQHLIRYMWEGCSE